jgi:hypothetical protein
MKKEKKFDKSARFYLILIIVAFVLTAVIGVALINPMLGVSGSFKNLVIAAEFFIFAFLSYFVLEKRID